MRLPLPSHLLTCIGLASVWLVAQLAVLGQEPAPRPTLANGDATPSVVPEPGVVANEAAISKPPITAGWDNGFLLRSEDKKYQLRITGQIQTDYRAFVAPADTTDVYSFLTRRARLGIEATVAEFYEFRLLPDFGQGQARIQDSYLNVHYWDVFQIEAGKFKQPFSYEQLIQDRFVPTLERSLLDQLVPARDVGLMVHGQKLFGDRLDYAMSIYSGVLNGDFDTNKSKDLAWRVAVRPFNSERFGPWLKYWQAGVSITTGFDQEVANPGTLRTPATVPWLQFRTAVRQDGFRSRFSPELAWFRGPFGIAGQYLHEMQQFRPTAAGPRIDVPANGFFVLATLLLTGEERTTYSQAVTPNRPFDLRHPISAPGAWELVARTSRLRFGSSIFLPGAAQLVDPTLYSPGATELTVGFNWYFNRWVRMQFNWERAWFDQPVSLGPGPAGLLGHQDALLTRFQVIF